MLWCYVARAAADRRARRSRGCAAPGARGRGRRPAVLGGGERRRPPRSATGRGSTCSSATSTRPSAARCGAARPRRARRDRPDLQPPGGPVRAADRGRLRGPPLEPRPRRRGGARARSTRLMSGEPATGARRRARPRRALPVLGPARGSRRSPRSTRPVARAGAPVASGPWGALYRARLSGSTARRTTTRASAARTTAPPASVQRPGHLAEDQEGQQRGADRLAEQEQADGRRRQRRAATG